MATPEESPEPTSFWSHKPWWCQPWTILMTGSLAIGGSWWLLHWLWLTLPIALLVLIWWCLFLIVVPGSGALPPTPPAP